MKDIPTLTVTTSREWRDWLRRHHDSASVIWLVFFKKHTGRVGIDYESAVEEALCFGWIDSLVRRLDDDRYLRKFTPRADTGRWSVANRQRVARLIRERRMTDAGLARVGYPHPERPPVPERRPGTEDVTVPAFMVDALRASGTAWKNFCALAPTYRRHYVGWVSSAKREQTRRRRLDEAIRLLEKNEKLGLK